MNATVNRGRQKGRTRVMIVDPEWQFGLELADCLATGGYQAILVRNLESMLDDLGELQPGAILLRADSYADKLQGQGAEALETAKALCPQAPMLLLFNPDQNTLPGEPEHRVENDSPVIPSTRVEELLQAKLGIPCARVI